ELEASAVGRPDDLPQLVHVGRLAVGREPHHLPLLAVLVEAEELRDGRVEEARRVRELDAIEDLEVEAPAYWGHRRDEVAEAVDREAGRLLEGRDEERARDVRLVVLDVVELRAQ